MGKLTMVFITTFLIDKNGVIEHVFDNFKTSNHHQVVLEYLAQHP